MAPSSNALRERVKGVRANSLAVEAVSKPKAKKGYMDIFCHNDSRPYARSGDKWIQTTIYRGIRYLSKPIDPPEIYPFIRKIHKKTTKYQQ